IWSGICKVERPPLIAEPNPLVVFMGWRAARSLLGVPQAVWSEPHQFKTSACHGNCELLRIPAEEFRRVYQVSDVLIDNVSRSFCFGRYYPEVEDRQLFCDLHPEGRVMLLLYRIAQALELSGPPPYEVNWLTYNDVKAIVNVSPDAVEAALRELSK